MPSLQSQLSQAQARETSDYYKWHCQLSGTATSGQVCKTPGNGPLAQADQQSYNADSTQVTQLTQQISQREQRLSNQQAATAKSALPAVRQGLQAADAQQTSETSNFNSQNESNTGLLIRLQALEAVTAGNSTLNLARLLLFTLFVVIDLMPVMIKVMLNMGEENDYDKMLEEEEKRQLSVAAVRRAARRSVEEAEIAAWERIRYKKLCMWEAEQLHSGSGAVPQEDSP